jgi:hypothetical protein
MSNAPQVAEILPNSGSESAIVGSHECTFNNRPEAQGASYRNVTHINSNPLGIELMADASQQKSAYPAITHIAVLSLLFGSITFAPYLLMRRKIAILSREISFLSSANRRLQNDFRTAILASSERKAEQLRIRGLAFETHAEAKALRTDFERKERAQTVAHSSLRRDIRKLEEEQSRYVLCSDSLTANNLNLTRNAQSCIQCLPDARYRYINC